MIVYSEVITQAPERCAFCQKELPEGYHGYVPIRVAYKELVEALDTVICLECKNKG